ncbi:hypothetical protein [Rhizohabitans arisaemae]|uniref:hypothetical protein n=1 Tax=Rhizohabitans arisaemae TaxID=2720610 RepID=UPI0024B12171|nr:hypothetical protein [Rhizohabitans arisaemae]
MRIDETLLNNAKALAAKQGRSLNSVMEDALRQLLKTQDDRVDRPVVDLVAFQGEAGYHTWVREARFTGVDIKHLDDEALIDGFVTRGVT